MKKNIKLFAVILMLVFFISCKEKGKINLSKNTILKPEIEDVTTSTLPNHITRNIIQDSKGNIWIAAFDGVFRYDGKSFTNITSKVSSARFFSVLEDRKGNFWFSSIGSGVYYYDGKSFQNFTTMDGLANDRVTDIYEDKSDNIWFGTEGGVSKYNGESFQNFTIKGALPNNNINSIIEDKTGKLWFGTKGSAFVYDGKTFTIITHNDKPFKNVCKIIEDKKGNIWLGGNDGLWSYNGRTFTNFTQNFIGYIYEDKNGNIWTSSQRFKDQRWLLSRYDEESLSNKKPTATEIESEYEANKGMIFGILEADNGNIWFGTLKGLNLYDGAYIYDGNVINIKSK
ncbi:hypothetical protein GCM10022393_34410 [Aquimarina addita]|uniref:Histidine kinase n=1 Tax=Aquimarina addita TaxID=870485 RepID=A0ABP6UU22_9FLAO